MSTLPNPPPEPAPGDGQSSPGVCHAEPSALAARIAAYLDAICLPHPDDGKVYPPPRPRVKLTHLISARIRRQEHNARRFEESLRNPPLDVEGMLHADD
jgi:hypothetical protein